MKNHNDISTQIANQINTATKNMAFVAHKMEPRKIINNFEKAKFWGNPIYLGHNKLHVYGLDKKNWEPIMMEITDTIVMLIYTSGEIDKSYAEQRVKELLEFK